MKGSIMRTFLVQTTTNSAIIPFTDKTFITFSGNKNGYALCIFAETHIHMLQFELDKENESTHFEYFQQKMHDLNQYLSAEQNVQLSYVLDLTNFNLKEYNIEVK